MLKTKNTLVIAITAIIITVFFFSFGSLTSGYHFSDDHEVLSIVNSLSKKPFAEVSADVISADFSWRYRPVYYLHRVTQCYVFGENFYQWSVYTMILCILTFSFFYLAIRKLGFSIAESILFLSVSFLGSQMNVWWRLGPNETLGSLFLALSFFFIGKCQNHYNRNTLWFSIFLILASLSKESYTIIMPAILLFKIWHEKTVFHITFRDSLYKNRLLAIPLAVMLFNLAFIVFFVGTDKVGYAGVDSSIFTKINEVLGVFKNLRIYFMITGIFIAAFFIFLRKAELNSVFKKLLIPFLIFILIVAPNIILYAKSGMDERYYLPATHGFALLLVFIAREIRFRKSWAALALIFIAFFCQRFQYREVVWRVEEFVSEGNDNNALFQAVLTNYSDNSTVLLAADPVASYEATHSVIYYLERVRRISFYGFPIAATSSWNDLKEFSEYLRQGWLTWFKGKLYQDLKKTPDIIIIMNNDLSDKFFKDSGLDPNKYSNKLSDKERYAVYVKK